MSSALCPFIDSNKVSNRPKTPEKILSFDNIYINSPTDIAANIILNIFFFNDNLSELVVIIKKATPATNITIAFLDCEIASAMIQGIKNTENNFFSFFIR